jgi:regulator of cell morphogenesis and NO signaling
MSTRTTIDPTRTVNEIMVRYPATVAVFNRFGIDTCCGSGVPVVAAAQREGVDPEALLAALEEVVGRS